MTITPGGDANEAMKIGTLIRSLFFKTVTPSFDWEKYDARVDGLSLPKVPTCTASWAAQPKESQNCTCDSSCLLIWVGGIERSGEFMGVHRPRFEKQFYGALEAASAKKIYNKMFKEIRLYLNDFNVSEKIIDKMVNTPSHDISIVSVEELNGFPPFFEERLVAKCGVMPKKESKQLRSLKLRNTYEKDLSSFEKSKLLRLKEDDYKIAQCNFMVTIVDRIKGFNKVFGADYYDNWVALNKKYPNRKLYKKPSSDIESKLKIIKKLLDQGLITKDDAAQKRKAILSNM